MLARLFPVVILALLLAGCGRGGDYAQQSPEDVFASARAMIENEEHQRLHELLWTDDPRERAVFLRVGRLLGALADLGEAVGERFPDEVDELIESETDLGGLFAPGRRGQRRGDAARERFDTLLRTIVADPYGALANSEGRLSAQLLSDTTAAVLWDGEGVLPPFGLVMRQVDGRWYLVPPTQNPFIARWRPRSDEEFAILGYLADVLTNAADELASEVRAGERRSLNDVVSAAGQKAFVPASMCVYAYAQAIEARDREPADAGGEG